jgi:hypothetical protein
MLPAKEYFTQSLPDPQTEYSRPTPGHPIARPADGDDFCHSCGAQIPAVVTEFAVSHSEIIFLCDFCTLDTAAPLPFVLTEGVSDAD